MQLTDDQIKEIAESLESGMKCYVNKLTGEIRTILDFDTWPGTSEELWEEDIKEIEDNRDSYLEFEPMPSQEAFNIMASFARSIDNQEFQERLFNALRMKKSFMQFKILIENSGEYKQKWFDFKKNHYIDYVKEQISYYTQN